MLARISVLSLLLVLGFSSYAQKVKYKDLIVLLTSKQYEKAEPFLKRYLKENDDNPNAYLYMGIIFHEKSLKMDPLVHTSIIGVTIDSAVMNYDKAYKTITDKELRKNDEYYEAYMRRDLRTGKFVIKLSDVQLDIENRSKGLKDKKEKVKLLKKYFDESSGSYVKANGIYKSLREKYGSEKEFFLRADDEMLKTLKRLIAVFDSTITLFDQYKTITKEIGKTGHNQIVDLQEIKDIKRDGTSASDFMKDDLKLWDYKRWAEESIEVIDKEIAPMREHLIAYDIELNKLREKLKNDSVSVKSDLTKVVDKIMLTHLKKYDPDPMPLSLFAMKVAELEYHSNVILYKPLKDSSNVKLRLSAIQTEINDLKKLDSLSTRLSKRNFDEEEKDYHHFISKAFGTASVLKSTISAAQDYAKRELVKKEGEWETTSQSLKWLISGADSIPLFTEMPRKFKFQPLVIEEEKFTFGIAYKDSLATGYFYVITPTRVAGVKANFPVDQTSFKRRFVSLIKGITTTDGTGNSFILLAYSSQKAKDKFPVTISKIYRADGLAWANNYALEMLPYGITLNGETGDITVTMLGNDGATKIVTLDKNGKMKIN